MKQYSEETLKRAVALFPIEYSLHQKIRDNREDAINFIRGLDETPYMHVNRILELIDKPNNQRGTNWGVYILKAEATKKRNIVALEELMLDEMEILKMEE